MLQISLIFYNLCYYNLADNLYVYLSYYYYCYCLPMFFMLYSKSKIFNIFSHFEYIRNSFFYNLNDSICLNMILFSQTVLSNLLNNLLASFNLLFIVFEDCIHFLGYNIFVENPIDKILYFIRYIFIYLSLKFHLLSDIMYSHLRLFRFKLRGLMNIQEYFLLKPS